MESACDIKEAAAPSRWRRRVVLALLAVIVSVGGWLRIAGVNDVGIRFEDEAAYYADARLWHRCAKLAMDPLAIAAVMMGEKEVLRGRVEQIGVRFKDRYRKPSQGYTVLGSAMMFVVGEGPGALAVVNALAGTASILLVYFIGVALCGRAVGLIGATVLALSPYHLLYSRSVFSDSTLIFFCLLGVYCWIRGAIAKRESWTTLILCALSFGYALTCHYRSGYVLGLVVCAEFLRVVTGAGPLTMARVKSVSCRWLAFSFLIFVPALLIELVFRAGQLGAWAFDAKFPFATYFESVFDWVGMERALGANVGGAHFWGIREASVRGYAEYLVHLQGIPACVLGVFGVVLLLRRRSVAMLPAVISIVTVLLLMSQPHIVARGLSLAIPYFAICTAVGIVLVSSWIARRRSAVVAVLSVAIVGLMALPSMGRVGEIYGRRSDFGDACAFLSLSGGGRVVVAEDTLKYDVFSGSDVELVYGRRYRASGSPVEMLQKMREDGVRWVIADPQRWHFRDAKFAARNRIFFWWQELEELLRVRATLVFETKHLTGSRWEFLAEGPGLAYLEEMSRRGDGAIRIYRLSPIAG
jgi:Dolichyl-phosphate-mannose-protein mannosyltransferase